MKIQWLGHSAFYISTDNHKLVIDPFMRDNPSCPLDPEDLEVDVICVTHGHNDHFGDTIELAQKKQGPGGVQP